MAIYKMMLDSSIHFWSIVETERFNEYIDKLNQVTVEYFRNDHRDLDKHEYHVFVSEETVEDAFMSGAKLIKDFISK